MSLHFTLDDKTADMPRVVQEVGHVHVHVIPKPSNEEGLGINWPAQQMAKEELQSLLEELKGKL